MFQIRHSKESWIVEHSAGKFERHTVFANIGIRFDLVPFELKDPTIHDLLSHTILSETTTTPGGYRPPAAPFSAFPLPSRTPDQSLGPLPPGSPAGVRSSGESPAQLRPPWIRAHTPDRQAGPRRHPMPRESTVSHSAEAAIR